MFKIFLDMDDIHMLRWSIKVARDAVFMQVKSENMPNEDAMALVSHLESIDNELVNQVRPTERDSSKDHEQLRLFEVED